MKLNKLFAITLAFPLFMAGCMSTTSLGQGSSVVSGASATGASGKPTSQGEAPELMKCDKPIAVVALAEGQGYAAQLSEFGLPESPVPLLRLMFQQSGCFQIVDRGRGLDAGLEERELAEKGLLKEGSNVGGGQLIAADYTITPNLVFSEGDAGGAALGAALIGAALGVGGGITASSKEAQVLLFLVDNRSGLQLASAEGSGKTTDIGFGGLLAGGVGGIGGGAWANTNQGKVVAAALLDATNNMISVIKSL